MTLFCIKGIKIKAHPLLLVMSFIWVITGYISTALIVYAALLLHEIAHMVAAAAFRVRIYEMELLPFGSAARMDDVFEQEPLKEAVIAACGPVMSLICASAAVTVSKYFPFFMPQPLKEFADYSFLIAGFNLIPALPLDGGRVLRACIARSCDFARATRICALLGILLGIALSGYGVYTFFGMQPEILVMMLGVFLLLSAVEEFKSSKFELAKCMLNRQRGRCGEDALNVRLIAVGQDMTLNRAAMLIKDRNYYVIKILNDEWVPIGSIDESRLNTELMNRDGHTRIGELLVRKH